MDLLLTRNEAFWPIQQRFNRLFESVLNEFGSSNSLSIVRNLGKSTYPKLDAYVNGNQFRVEVCCPGTSYDDLKVEMSSTDEGKVITISGEMNEQYKLPDSAVYHIQEMRRTSFKRQILLPAIIDSEPSAILENGILRLTWEIRQPPKPEIKRIPIANKIGDA